MADLIKFKRGKAATWKEKNILLNAGEPGYELDTHKFKIGDGFTPWNDLPYIGEQNIQNYSTHYDFPSIGNSNYLYKAESEDKIYQWNSSYLTYSVISSMEGTVDDIDLIHGGNANGTA